MKPWKVQKFASDVVYDLRSRGLLPLAALMLVCIFAAPILISGMGASSDVAPPLATPGAESASELAPEGQAAVLAYSPGLRNYRKRLDELASKDPFKQQFAASAATADQATEVIDSETLAGGEVPGSGGGSGGTDTGSGGSGNGGGSGKTKTQTYYFFYQTDLRVGASGTELSRRNKVPEFTLLPSEQVPALVFLGAAANGKQAIFSVSRSVTSVSGSGICYPEPGDCELLGLGRGEGADLAYSADGKTYRVEVAQIKRVKSTKPPG